MSPIWVDPCCCGSAELGTVAPGGKDEVEAALKRPVPEFGLGRNTLGPGLDAMGVGSVRRILGPGKD